MVPLGAIADDLTRKQREFVEAPGSVVALACAGSGKTRALVARFNRAVADGTGGVALLSFTNAAIESAVSRCDLGASRAPNFIGTVDSFLHRFIVTPYFAVEHQLHPRYVNTYDELASFTNVALRGLTGSGIPLDYFRRGDVVIPSGAWRATAYLRAVEGAGRRNDLLYLADKRREGLLKAGILSAEVAREVAVAALTPQRGATILKRLRSRFTHVVLDEYQDCSDEDVSILRLLVGDGELTMAVVADFEQGIYEFRDGGSLSAVEFLADQAWPEVIFNSNYRSTPAICKLAESLRSDDVSVDAQGPLRTDPTPILICPGSPDEARMLAEGALGDRGLSSSQSIIVAHRSKDARTHAGGRQPPGIGESLAARLYVAAVGATSRGRIPRERQRSFNRARQLVANGIEGLDPDNLETSLADSKVEVTGFNRAVWGLLHVLAATEDMGQIADAIYEELRVLCGSLGLVWEAPKVRKLNDKPMKALQELRLPEAGWKYSTVHGVKGDEFESVILVLTDTGGSEGSGALSHWADGLSSEARKVLHVGATRPERLLFLAPGPHLDQLLLVLERDGVPHEVLGLPEPQRETWVRATRLEE